MVDRFVPSSIFLSVAGDALRFRMRLDVRRLGDAFKAARTFVWMAAFGPWVKSLGRVGAAHHCLARQRRAS